MTRRYGFGLFIVFTLILPTMLFAVPLHPDTEAALKASGQFQHAKEAYLNASQRGLDQPNPYPIKVQDLDQTDEVYLNVLTILVDFSDNQADTATYSIAHYEELLYSQGVFPTGSLRDYYLQNSYNFVHIVGEAAGWFRMPHTYAYYVDGNYGFGNYPNNAQKLTEDAVAAADPYVDFSQYDNNNDGYVDALFVVHAGPGAEQTGNVNNIWSHAWVTYNVPYVDGVFVYSYSQEPEDGHIGVFGHELGHALFGLPDLYDYGYDSQGTGVWSMMSGGCWGGGGVTPVLFDAWSKVTTGFVIPTNVTQNQTSVALPQVETNSVIHRLWTNGNPGPEYFLVENRQEVGFDVSLPANGMLIYHIEEENGSNNNQWYPGYTSNGHYLVAVEQADGLWQLEHNTNSGNSGDPWPGSTNHTTFDSTTTPDSRDYNFQSTAVAVRNISASAATMYADFEVTVSLPPTGVDVVLTPAAPPIMLPPAGGSFEYDIEITNYDPTPAQTQYWAMLILPGGAPYGPISGPYNLTIPGNGVINRTRIQNIPARAPSGEYQMVGYLGTYPGVVEDSSFFTFVKIESTTGVEEDLTAVPQNLALLPCYPNPFNPSTTISFTLPMAQQVSLTVYDSQGRQVAVLMNGWRSAGMHTAVFDASHLASGVYVYRLQAGEFIASEKMMLVK
ncbi:MAG: M6 family metalloprotease domain-containing protein [bacterium]